MEREKIIELVKALGITAEELGINREIEKDTQFIHEVSQMIIGMDIQEEARDNISEKYWEDLGIVPRKKYKVVRCKMGKMVFKYVNVAIPEDEDDGNADNYIENLDDIDLGGVDDEDSDWDMIDWRTEGSDLTANEVRDIYNDIWNKFDEE